jgi:hypothetical protein
MSMQLGPIDICCDSPPYNIVQACKHLGFRTPEDVRWSRAGRLSDEKSTRHGSFGQLALDALRAVGGRGPSQCVCGRGLPAMQRYLFLLLNGKELSYFLGQCERCQTIFWDAA